MQELVKNILKESIKFEDILLDQIKEWNQDLIKLDILIKEAELEKIESKRFEYLKNTDTEEFRRRIEKITQWIKLTEKRIYESKQYRSYLK